MKQNYQHLRWLVDQSKLMFLGCGGRAREYISREGGEHSSTQLADRTGVELQGGVNEVFGYQTCFFCQLLLSQDDNLFIQIKTHQDFKSITTEHLFALFSKRLPILPLECWRKGIKTPSNKSTASVVFSYCSQLSRNPRKPHLTID